MTACFFGPSQARYLFQSPRDPPEKIYDSLPPRVSSFSTRDPFVHANSPCLFGLMARGQQYSSGDSCIVCERGVTVRGNGPRGGVMRYRKTAIVSACNLGFGDGDGDGKRVGSLVSERH